MMGYLIQKSNAKSIYSGINKQAKGLLVEPNTQKPSPSEQLAQQNGEELQY
jgi:hypothetical protein